MEVYKFGGASVKDSESVKNVAEILKNKENNLLIVISAMAKTTNQLEILCKSFINQDDKTQVIFEEIKHWHLSLLNELIPNQNNQVYEQIENLFVELDWILEEQPHDDHDFVYDQIVSFGELFSTCIVAAYLIETKIPCIWQDARNFIKTDNSYREAKIEWEETQSEINKLKILLKNKIVLTQGFIGGTSENYTSTLGREGSDYSAAIFANCLNAESMTIWKDVDGVLTADPKFFPNATLIEKLSYSEAIEMTYFGATVIHPKTIKPLQNKNIPLFVKPFLKPNQDGTYVGIVEKEIVYLPCIIIKQNQILLSISSFDLSFIAEEHLHEIFGLFAKNQVKINLMQNAALSFSVCFDHDLVKTERLLNSVKQRFSIRYNENLQLVTIRHYNDQFIQNLIGAKKVYLEQRSRTTVQFLTK